MINIEVERLPADKRGPDISNSLILTKPVGIEKGRNEIDRNYSNREIISSTGPYDKFIRPGKIIEVADSEQHIWRGQVNSCAIVINQSDTDFTATVNLRIERESSK